MFCCVGKNLINSRLVCKKIKGWMLWYLLYIWNNKLIQSIQNVLLIWDFFNKPKKPWKIRLIHDFAYVCPPFCISALICDVGFHVINLVRKIWFTILTSLGCSIPLRIIKMNLLAIDLSMPKKILLKKFANV